MPPKRKKDVVVDVDDGEKIYRILVFSIGAESLLMNISGFIAFFPPFKA